MSEKNELPAEVALALAIFDVAALEGLDALAEAIAATSDPAEVEALLRAWGRQVQIDAQRLFDETCEQIGDGYHPIH
jgi:hypothetical protein